MDRFKAGIIQFDVRLGQIDANVESVVTGISELAEAGADIAVLPEMWSCGFDHENLKAHVARTPEILALLGRLARENRMVIAGSLPAMNGQAVTNTLYLIDSDGTLRSGYSKIHLFSPGSEHLHFAAGDKTAVCDLELGKTGLMTCYDIRFPELGRNLA
ncbi:MAG: carbon-nitrogen family hydrolase, partial [Desulfobacteraceae bacterium]|nr:carbon-nitrogen family hydrolase [Desulfobacteraceae bacterium]